MRKFENIDLNLLLAFDALVTERHVSNAARRLNVSQPALSHTLKKLRHTFNDEILVRTAKGMEPTEYAEALHASMTPALIALREAIEGPVDFDPANVNRTITLGISDSAVLMILPLLLKRLEKKAPGLEIVCDQCGPDESMRRARDGEMDLVIGYYAGPSLHGLVGRTLSTVQTYYGIADKNNAAVKNGSIDKESYLALPHVAVRMYGGKAPVDTAIESLGLVRKIRVTAPSFSVVPALVRGTNMIGHCGKRIVSQLVYRDELVFFEPPIPLSVNHLRAVWRRSVVPDSAVMWLIDEIAEIVEEVESAEIKDLETTP